jgi:hypothetical protein
MRRGFARVGATRRLIASRLLQLAKINGRLKQLRSLSQSRLRSGPNNPWLFGRILALAVSSYLGASALSKEAAQRAPRGQRFSTI